jgi:hypothetical protein
MNMNTPQSNLGLTQQESVKPRRRFIRQLGTLLGGLVIWRVTELTPNASLAKESVSQPALTEHPKPKYIPRGFVEETAVSGQAPNRLDGFGDNPQDIVYWYRTPYHERGRSNPLCIYVSGAPVKQFVGVEDRTPTLVNVPKGPGLNISAEYYDGIWMVSPAGERILPKGTRLTWDTSNVHSLVFRYDEYTFAIRGSRIVGINLNELIRIASSIE